MIEIQSVRYSQEGNEKIMKKVVTVIVVAVVCVAAGFGIYFHSDHYKEMASHYPDNTYINGVDCSGLTVDQAEKKLTKKWQGRTFVINKDGAQAASISLAGVNFDIKDSLKEQLGTNFFHVMRQNTSKSKKEFAVSMKMDHADQKKVKNDIRNSSFLDIDYKVKTKDAYVDMSDTKFRIVKEVQGDNVDKDKVADTAVKDIAKGDFSMDFKASKFAAKPKVTADSEILKEEQEFDKKNYSQKITYDEYNKKYTVEPKDLAKMMPKDGNGTKLDEKAVKKFVDKTLAWEVNTQYAKRRFKSSDQGIITVMGGSYGYVIDKKKEAEKLTADLKSGKDVERKPVYSQTPYYKGGGMNDIGDSYIEVSISSQTLWLYKNGKKKMTTAVTTGKSGHDTACGVFYIAYKQRNTTLRGANDDGSSYESPVSYWMPFNGGQGCHDAPWRSSFGGGGYVSNGSHGCVNMQTGAAAYLYSQIKAGYPIVVHS